jgi:Spy/CpxP family protein refolding chaperone
MDKSWRVILAFVGIFIAGTVTGGLISLRLAQSMSVRGERPRPAGQPQVAGGAGNQAPQQFNPQLMRRVAEQLNLTPDQKEKMKLIEARTGEELRRLRRENLHSTELIIEKCQDDIAALLNPEQRAKFDEMILRARERIRKFMQERVGKRESVQGLPADRPRDNPPKSP